MQLPLTSFGNEPLLLSVDTIEAYISLEAPPEPRSEEEILPPDVYDRIIKDREKNAKEAEKKRIAQEKEIRKQMEKEKQNTQNNDATKTYFDFDQKQQFTLATGLPRFIERILTYSRLEISTVKLFIRAPPIDAQNSRTNNTSPQSHSSTSSSSSSSSFVNAGYAFLFEMKDLILYSTDMNWAV